MAKIALLIPIYQVEEVALPFLKQFKEGDFCRFLVVDDGSGTDYKKAFEDIAEQTVFEVIGYRQNRGKGHALRYGMKHLLELEPDLDGIVTADGDGQHAYQDILRVKDALVEHPSSLVLGTRVFDRETMPWASKVGNDMSHFKFAYLAEKEIKDSQTGLRGIPSKLFDTALRTKGERYEYESSFLLFALKKTDLVQVDIESIYIDHNRASHFRPIRDTLRINRWGVAFILIILAFLLMSIGLFAFFSSFAFAGFERPLNAIFSTLISHTINSSITFWLLYLFVFDQTETFWFKVIKMSSFYFSTLILSLGLTFLFASTLSWPLILIKLLVEGAMVALLLLLLLLRLLIKKLVKRK